MKKLLVSLFSVGLVFSLTASVYALDPGSLSVGTKGDEVTVYQRFLNTLGIYTEKIDGAFGKLTEAAVKEFQQLNGLAADGVLGQQTKASVVDAVLALSVVETDKTPRIAYWYGKVNQYVDIKTGEWKTDPTGSYGATENTLSYCRMHYPNTVSAKNYKQELITGWRDRGNVGGPYSKTVLTVECVQETVVDSKKKPEAKTLGSSSVTNKSARLSFSVNNYGVESTVWFQYGTQGYFGRKTSTVLVSGQEDVVKGEILLEELKSNTAYTFRAVIKNKNGTVYGEKMSFTTNSSSALPVCVPENNGYVSVTQAWASAVITALDLSGSRAAIVMSYVPVDCVSSEFSATEANTVIYDLQLKGSEAAVIRGLVTTPSVKCNADEVNISVQPNSPGGVQSLDSSGYMSVLIFEIQNESGCTVEFEDMKSPFISTLGLVPFTKAIVFDQKGKAIGEMSITDAGSSYPASEIGLMFEERRIENGDTETFTVKLSGFKKPAANPKIQYGLERYVSLGVSMNPNDIEARFVETNEDLSLLLKGQIHPVKFGKTVQIDPSLLR